MDDALSEAVALRNAERALDAINRASPLTRRRVTDILHSYNSSIGRKIERLNTMLHHDATELFAMASNESALPFRAVQAEVRRMFLGAHHQEGRGYSANAKSAATGLRPSVDSFSEGERHQMHLQEAGRFDTLDAQVVRLLREVHAYETSVGRRVSDSVVLKAEEASNTCSCSACSEYAMDKLDRVLADGLANVTADLSETYVPSMGVHCARGLGEIVPAHICSQLNRALCEELMLELEAIELEGHQRMLNLEVGLLRRMGSLEAIPAQTASLHGEDTGSHGASLSDSIVSYSQRLIEHSSALTAQRLDNKVVAWGRDSWGITTRLAMLSRLLPIGDTEVQ